MAANNNARVDTTFIGYLLIGFFLLLFGVFGLQEGGLFGDFKDFSNYSDMPIDVIVFGHVCGVVGLILVILSIFAYRTGKKGAAGIFAFVALYGIFTYLDITTKMGQRTFAVNSNWFIMVAFAIFFLIFAIYALVEKAPKFVALFLLLMALYTFFVGLACLNGLIGTYNVDLYHAFGIVYAIFAFLGFIVATYLGLAYADPKKIPLI